MSAIDFVRRAGWIFAAEFILRAIKVVCGLIIIRLLAPEQFGVYSILFAAATTFGFIYDPGLTTLVLKKFSSTRKYFGLVSQFLSIKIVVLGIAGIFFFLVVLLGLAPGSELIEAAAMFALVAFNEMTVLLFSVLRAQNYTQREVLLRLFHGVTTIAFLYALFFFEADLLKVLFAQLVPTVLIIPFIAIQLKTLFSGHIKSRKKNITYAIFRRLQGIFWFQCFVVIWSTIELLLAAQLFDSEKVGTYGAALRLFLLAQLPSAVLGTVLLPHLGAIRGDSKTAAQNLWLKLGRPFCVCLLFSTIFLFFRRII